MFNIFKKLFKNKSKLGFKKKKKGIISDWSYQRFCGFYDTRIFPDLEFDNKIKKIIHCVKDKHLERLDEIAQESNCTVEETVMKIRYLKNKRILDDIFIDNINRVVKKCTLEDTKILEKYYTMLYVDHFSIDEMAQRVPNFHNKPFPIIKEDVYKDIKYLYDRCVVNGIKLDDYRKEIIYYTVEKHKKALTYATVNCTKCGALVDVSRGGNGRCDYCGSLVEDNTDGKF